MGKKKTDQIFKALADATRRDILDQLSNQGEQTIHQLAEPYKMSRQAVSKHLRILKDAGLIKLRKQGREQHCSAQLDGLERVTDWIQNHREVEPVEAQPSSLDDLLQSAHQG